jgi:hypothetical protein
LGFETPEQVLAKFREIVQIYTKDLEPEDLPQTLSIGPHHATIEVPDRIPRSLNEGYLRGFVAAMGGTLERFTVTPLERDQRAVLRFELRWS